MKQEQAAREIRGQIDRYIGSHIVLPTELVAAAIGWEDWLPADERVASTQQPKPNGDEPNGECPDCGCRH